MCVQMVTVFAGQSQWGRKWKYEGEKWRNKYCERCSNYRRVREKETEKNGKGKESREKKREHQWGTLLRPSGSFWWKMAAVLKGDISMNALSLEETSRRTLNNCWPFWLSLCRLQGPVALNQNPDPLGMSGISINRVWYQNGTSTWSCAHPSTTPSLHSINNIIFPPLFSPPHTA